MSKRYPLSLISLFTLTFACSEFGVDNKLSAARGATTLTGDDDNDEIDCNPFIEDCTRDDDGTGDDDDDDDDDDNSDGDDDDDNDDDDDDSDEADLPYAAELELGDTFVLWDAFAEEGALPSAILSVTMEEGGDWRLDELQSLTPFTVDQADCDHEGNRDEGRDRIEVTWENADGSQDEDHLDLRYCGS